MVFNTRNLYYLRIADRTVIPLYLFLDEHHTNWMSDLIFQRVLIDLRPHIIPKLRQEDTKRGKATIYTLQGDEYRLCYFFRNADNQSVLVKRRIYTSEPVSSREVQHGKGKRKATPEYATNAEESRKQKRKRKGKQSTKVGSSDVSATTGVGYDADGPLGQDATGGDTTSTDARVASGDDMDITEEKPKPRMQLKYEGVQTNGQCLCVVVEPLPQRNGETELESVTMGQESVRNGEPLFLPEQANDAGDDHSSDAGDGGVVAFSQRLYGTGDYATGLPDDGEDSDGEVFFSDADDAREY